MNKHRLKHKFIFIILVSSIINVLITLIWVSLRISPHIPEINFIKETAIVNDINYSFNSFDSFHQNINSFEKNNNVYVQIFDNNNKCINCNNNKLQFFIESKVVIIEGKPYLIKVFGRTNINFTKMILQLILLQFIITFILYIIFFALTREMVLKPINEIIENIRKYKFGVKPKKKEIKHEFDLINNEFVELTDKLEEEKQEQNRIIASISHDIKTPLTTIIGYSDLLSEQELNEESLEYNQKINSKANHIKDILSSFDDYLVNKQTQQLKLEKVLIGDIVKNIYDDYKMELKNQNIKLNIISKIDNEYIKIDLLKMKRIFSNIISNSARYLKEGGKIDINITKDDNNYIFKISDNGPGVDEKIIDKIFEPLYTTDNSRKLSGLGLSICKEFVLLHNGTIKAYNKNGLTIEFTIPKSN